MSSSSINGNKKENIKDLKTEIKKLNFEISG